MSEAESVPWKDILKALENTHTISTRGICQLLQCSRTWVNTYVTPFVPYIRLSQGYKEDHVNWLYRARTELKKDMHESVWFDTQKLYEYLNSHIVSVTAQTRLVSLYSVLTDDEKQSYIRDNQQMADEMAAYMESVKEFMDMVADMGESAAEIKDVLTEINEQKFKGDRKFLQKQNEYIRNYLYRLQKCGRLADPTKRTSCPHTAVPVKLAFGRDRLRAVHDIKDYGDTDELIYRDLFRSGAVRVELSLPDKNGKLSKKIYYHIPQNDFAPEDDFDRQVTVPYIS